MCVWVYFLISLAVLVLCGVFHSQWGGHRGRGGVAKIKVVSVTRRFEHDDRIPIISVHNLVHTFGNSVSNEIVNVYCLELQEMERCAFGASKLTSKYAYTLTRKQRQETCLHAHSSRCARLNLYVHVTCPPVIRNRADDCVGLKCAFLIP